MLTKNRAQALLAGAAAVLLSACSITRTVDPLPPVEIRELHVLENPDVLMDAFLPELEELLAERGIATSVYTGAPPEGCRHRLEYTATWQWDMAMYVTYIELRVYDEGNRIGRAIYDARRGGGSFRKFGSTREKLASVIEPLLAEVNSGQAPEPAAQDAPPEA